MARAKGDLNAFSAGAAAIAKLKDGEATEPTARAMDAVPASTVLALNRLTESQINVA
jgi:hypothetical protein